MQGLMSKKLVYLSLMESREKHGPTHYFNMQKPLLDGGTVTVGMHCAWVPSTPKARKCLNELMEDRKDANGK